MRGPVHQAQEVQDRTRRVRLTPLAQSHRPLLPDLVRGFLPYSPKTKTMATLTRSFPARVAGFVKEAQFMSHIVTIESGLRDPIAVAAACRRLGLAEPKQGTAQLYSGEATGLLVQLPEWQFPIVIDTATGSVKMDNFEGRWGSQDRLDHFLQSYAVEVATLE